jgi:hypothetical protein
VAKDKAERSVGVVDELGWEVIEYVKTADGVWWRRFTSDILRQEHTLNLHTSAIQRLWSFFFFTPKDEILF